MTLRVDAAHLHAIGDDEPLADRKVVTRIERESVVLVRAGQHAPRFLGVERELISASRVEQVIRGIALHIEAESAERALLAPCHRVQAKCDQVRIERWILQRLF